MHFFSHTQSMVIAMTKLLVVVTTFVAALAAIGFIEVQTRVVRSLELVGIPNAFVKDCMWSSFSGRYFSYPSVEKLKKVAAGDRAAVVREIAEFAKHYTRSEEFRQKYQQFREDQKPEKPAPPPTAEQRRRTDKAELQKSLREMEANMKQAPADQKPVFEQTLSLMKQQVKEIDNPNNAMYSAEMDKYSKQSYEMELTEYAKRMQEWERAYPPSPNPMIKKWLTQFLEESRDVDFAAKLRQDEQGEDGLRRCCV